MRLQHVRSEQDDYSEANHRPRAVRRTETRWQQFHAATTIQLKCQANRNATTNKTHSWHTTEKEGAGKHGTSLSLSLLPKQVARASLLLPATLLTCSPHNMLALFNNAGWQYNTQRVCCIYLNFIFILYIKLVSLFTVTVDRVPRALLDVFRCSLRLLSRHHLKIPFKELPNCHPGGPKY